MQNFRVCTCFILDQQTGSVLGVSAQPEAIDLRFEIARPLFGFELAVKGLAPRLHATTTHLGFPASSELPDRRHVTSNDY